MTNNCTFDDFTSRDPRHCTYSDLLSVTHWTKNYDPSSFTRENHPKSFTSLVDKNWINITE